MTSPRNCIGRGALAMMSGKIVAMQIALASLVFALTVFWLRLPDSSALRLIATVLVGLLLAAIASGGESALLLRLCGKPLVSGRLLRGAVSLLLAAALWLGWSALLEHVRANDSMLAGYWNSRFSASLRNTFSYTHLYRWLEWMWNMLAWVGAGVCAAIVFSITASEHVRKAIRFTLLSATFWITLLGIGVIVPLFTGWLMHWTPGHGLAVETISLIVRISAAVTVDAVIVVAGLAVVGSCIERSDSRYAADAGVPEASQVLTVERP